MAPSAIASAAIGLAFSRSEIARILRCSDRRTHRWASGKTIIPPGFAARLEAWVTVRQAYPEPLPPGTRTEQRGHNRKASWQY
jgi:hypothetical protein